MSASPVFPVLWHSHAALHLLCSGTGPGWWDEKHPLLWTAPEFPNCPLILAQLGLKKCGGGSSHLLVGCFYQAEQSEAFALWVACSVISFECGAKLVQ